jgi:hypothetical protein
MRGEVFRRMDEGATALGQAGYRVDWGRRTLSGFPFRLDLDIESPRMREVSGWGVAAPRLKAEAFVFAPDHWVIVAPAGVTITRRRGGDLRLGARVLRASLSDALAHPPRLSVEGLDLTLAAAPGTAPAPFASARELHFHAKAGPRDQGAAYLEIDKAMAVGPGPLADIAAGAPMTLIADGVYSHAGALTGVGFTGALLSWSAAGGDLQVRRLSLQAGSTRVEARSGTLSVGADGRLRGSLGLDLKPAQRLMATLGAHSRLAPEAARVAQAVLAAHDQGGAAAVSLYFQAGQTTLGPVAVGPAPRVY